MKYFFIVMAFLLCYSCVKEQGKQLFWDVANVANREERIAVLIKENPAILNIYVSGETDGDFQIIAAGNGQNKVFEFKSGKIDTIISDNWKSVTCKTIYAPKNVTSGNIKLSTLIYPKDEL